MLVPSDSTSNSELSGWVISSFGHQSSALLRSHLLQWVFACFFHPPCLVHIGGNRFWILFYLHALAPKVAALPSLRDGQILTAGITGDGFFPVLHSGDYYLFETDSEEDDESVLEDQKPPKQSAFQVSRGQGGSAEVTFLFVLRKKRSRQ